MTASVEWVRSAATRQGVVVYTHPTIHERGSGRMMSAATVPLVPLGHGWGGGGVGAGRQPTARSVDKTERNWQRRIFAFSGDGPRTSPTRGCQPEATEGEPEEPVRLLARQTS